jgi:hypothetical protein
VTPVPEPAARPLRVLLAAMAAGLFLLAGVVVYFHLTYSGAAPDLRLVAFENRLTMGAMAGSAALIVASEAVWRGLLRAGGAGSIPAAFLARAALREGAALLGLLAALLCAQHGVLAAYPAYWANLAPFALFLAFVRLHWPTAEGLAAEASEILPK